ncbi:DHA2 family efflux MFS transporter permease subunit [Simkania negevensis]|uniref:Multidrug resistance protein B n=1 Tax=Simkania negevensis (strain ATCC VR-1471 / DSM 27360 / Z) TaxID=331113 RepID=F8L4V9_SIMNZ|nr:DHA2 family efflux MFS transporter permease subunit [Simkania negevensis]CCB88930.1 multidrug resistance protein B [Simkania negevensis Z]
MAHEELEPLVRLPLILGGLALSLCTFMQVLDTSIANVAVPYIAGDLAVSNEDGTWVITMFAVGNAIALPLTGWFTKCFGTTRVMLVSTALFTLLSVLCALSMNINMLVFMRFTQGFVGGPLIPLSQSMLMMSFPKTKRNLGLAIWQMVAIVGPIAGPIIGGWITYNYSWPWIFYINVPVGILASIIIWNIYKSRETPREKQSIDWIGLALLAIGVSALQILLDKGQQYDWWRSNTIVILGIVSVLSLLLLVIWVMTDENPIVDLKLFTNRNFALGTALTAISYMVLFGAIVISPLMLQTNMGYTSTWAGLAVASMGIPAFLTVLLVAKLMDKISLKVLIALSFIFYAISFFFFTRLDTNSSFELIFWSRFVMGIGITTYLAPLTVLSFARFPHHQLAMGQGIFHFFRIFMGGVGASLSVTLWQRRGVLHHSNLVDSISPFQIESKQMFATLAQEGIVGKQALQVADDLVWHQAVMLGANDVFWVSMWIMIFLVIGTIFFKKRRKKNATVEVAASH